LAAIRSWFVLRLREVGVQVGRRIDNPLWTIHSIG
jgi:hypothetical protein